MPSTAGFWVTLDISWFFKMCCYDLSFHFLLFIFPSFSEVVTSAFDLSPVETTLAFNRYCVSSEEQTFLWAWEEKKQGEEQERFMRHVSGSQTFSTAWHFCREDCSQTSTPAPHVETFTAIASSFYSSLFKTLLQNSCSYWTMEIMLWSWAGARGGEGRRPHFGNHSIMGTFCPYSHERCLNDKKEKRKIIWSHDHTLGEFCYWLIKCLHQTV